METLLIIAATFLGFSNGANDNFKGFATVWGSDTLTYRQALTLATIATILGGLMSLILSESLMQQFSGKGLVPPDVAGNPAFIVSIALAAACTVLLATRMGLPISTTHALIGALVGAGLATGEGIVHFGQLTHAFVLPLLVSPVVAGTLGFAVYRLLSSRTRASDCACLVATSTDATASGAAVLRTASPQLLVGSDSHCDRLAEPVVRLRLSHMLDRFHALSAASICFARAVNDTPKLAALLVAARLIGARASIVVIAAVMAAGGLLFARHVAQTMSQRMVRMDQVQGLVANVITAALVIFASKLGMPVSTTQVSVGSIAGTGLVSGAVNWTTLRGILLSWVATLPIAALIAYLLAHVL
ncbi:MAG TPA: anion permease [Steroidobacteraceae bacterium]|jgi:PiT family inorganic phosphate transporter|nr:anion permease [Steroidobacteraceae bacterium]